MDDIPINVIPPTDLGDIFNNDNLGDNGDSGGISRWLFWTIITIVVVLVVGLTVFLVRYFNRRSRESGSIVKDVAESISTGTEQKVANQLLDVAIRSATESAQLEANTQTAASLYATGEASQADVKKAIIASELSKTGTYQKNIEAARALEELRKKQLAQADAAVLAATQEKSKLSADYQNLSNDIIAQKIKEAEAVLLEVTSKRQAADQEFNSSVALRIQAEKAAQQKVDEGATQKQGIIASANAKLRDIVAKVNASKKATAEFIKKKQADARAPKQPKPAPAPKPAPVPKPAPAPGPCQYAKRVATPSGWKCPTGFIDTGLDWGDVDGGTKQCRTPRCPQPEKKPAPPAPAPSPAPSGGKGTVVLQGGTVKFPTNQGNYAGKGGQRVNVTKPIPRNMERSCLLEWDVFFPKGFFVGCQGKLGGLFLAPRGGSGRASGCADKKDRTGASYRIMFGKTPSVYQYFYFNNKTSQTGAMAKEDRCGLGHMVDDFKNIKEGDWNSLKIGLKLNDIGQRNGLAYINVNGKEATQGGIMWAADANFVITSMSFNAFYGGCTGSPAANRLPSTYLEMRNMRVSQWI